MLANEHILFMQVALWMHKENIYICQEQLQPFSFTAKNLPIPCLLRLYLTLVCYINVRHRFHIHAWILWADRHLSLLEHACRASDKKVRANGFTPSIDGMVQQWHGKPRLQHPLPVSLLLLTTSTSSARAPGSAAGRRWALIQMSRME